MFADVDPRLVDSMHERLEQMSTTLGWRRHCCSLKDTWTIAHHEDCCMRSGMGWGLKGLKDGADESQSWTSLNDSDRVT